MKPETLNKEVGKRVRRERLRAKGKPTQEGLAESIGVSRTTIVNIESGRQITTLANLIGIAMALRIPAARLLPPQRWKKDR